MTPVGFRSVWGLLPLRLGAEDLGGPQSLFAQLDIRFRRPGTLASASSRQRRCLSSHRGRARRPRRRAYAPGCHAPGPATKRAFARHAWTSSGSLFVGLGVHDVDPIGQTHRLKYPLDGLDEILVEEAHLQVVLVVEAVPAADAAWTCDWALLLLFLVPLEQVLAPVCPQPLPLGGRQA